MDEAEEGKRLGEARLSSATDASCHSPNLYASPMRNKFPQASIVNGYEMCIARWLNPFLDLLGIQMS